MGIELLEYIIVGGTNERMFSFRGEKMLNVTERMGERGRLRIYVNLVESI